MNRFKPGQQVVCTHKGTWISIVSTSGQTLMGNGPEFNEICTILDYQELKGRWGYLLAAYEINSFTGNRMLFTARWFEPLVSNEVLQSELNTIELYEQTI